MTALQTYLASVVEAAPMHDETPFDEFAAANGAVRPGWASVIDVLNELSVKDLVHAGREVTRLLEDDGVRYTPKVTPQAPVNQNGPGEEDLPISQPWRLDPLPLMIDDREWSALELGLVQRAELLAAILSDVYGAQQLIAEAHIPAAAIFDHDEYLRAMVGVQAFSTQRLFMVAADLGRDASGQWKVMSDRTQAPSGAGFAMQNRRVVSRVMPELYQQAHLHRLTPYFHAMRIALVDAAPAGVEDPLVVVLSPGAHSETAFDQAFVASLLGFPLLEGSDLTVRDGRVWMRVLGKLEPVDVILRRVDARWTDPLELRPGSRLGVAGLSECVRRGTVSVVNNLGSGVLENPALMPLLPVLAERLLGGPLRLPSVDTWWCGEENSLSHVLAHLDELVISPVSRGAGRGVVVANLTSDQRGDLVARIRQTPHRFAGQEILPLSSAPTTDAQRLVSRDVTLRSFAVRQNSSYSVMLGGLARVSPAELHSDQVHSDSVNLEAVSADPALASGLDGGVAKDVWVISRDPIAAVGIVRPRGRRDADPLSLHPPVMSSAMVPRVLSDLFWFGRYAERAEDLLRLVLATQSVGMETDFNSSRNQGFAVLLRAVTHVSAAYPGFLTETPLVPELRAMLLDRQRHGTAAQSLAGLGNAAQGVRDQLSADVWMVLASIDRATEALRVDRSGSMAILTDTGEHMLAGLLALAGIVSENMVRDPGWHMLDAGRGLERALQVLSLLRVTLVGVPASTVEQLVTEAVLSAAESIVTYRRRYRGRAGVGAVVELLVTDPFNPRSVAFQLQRVLGGLQSIPNTPSTSRPLRVLHGLVETVRTIDLDTVTALNEHGSRAELDRVLAGLQDQLRTLSEAIGDQYLQPPPTQRDLGQTALGGLAS